MTYQAYFAARCPASLIEHVEKLPQSEAHAVIGLKTPPDDLTTYQFKLMVAAAVSRNYGAAMATALGVSAHEHIDFTTSNQ